MCFVKKVLLHPGRVLAQGQLEQVVFREELGETDVVRDEGGDDTASAADLVNVRIRLEVACSHKRTHTQVDHH